MPCTSRIRAASSGSRLSTRDRPLSSALKQRVSGTMGSAERWNIPTSVRNAASVASMRTRPSMMGANWSAVGLLPVVPRMLGMTACASVIMSARQSASIWRWKRSALGLNFARMPFSMCMLPSLTRSASNRLATRTIHATLLGVPARDIAFTICSASGTLSRSMHPRTMVTKVSGRGFSPALSAAISQSTAPSMSPAMTCAEMTPW
mmetsp:Transcript_51239/g.163831  ORF Transcript_51239/g.163831 Transcript_51239/m.163831 type:complete len:206 (+) Transcript_51239:162-779(+)